MGDSIVATEGTSDLSAPLLHGVQRSNGTCLIMCLWLSIPYSVSDPVGGALDMKNKPISLEYHTWYWYVFFTISYEF